MAYLIDANVLIEAKNKHYGFTFCPGFWNWLLGANAKGSVYLIPQVMAEIKKGKDQLKNWCSVNGGLCIKSAPALSKSMADVSNWVHSQSYTPAAVATFLTAADYSLVAWAHAGGHTVITHETAGSSPNRVKIPDPCNALGVKYLSPFKMLESEGAKFII
jgi:hypothetical protein